jgi:hypothetical protein
MQAVLFGFLLCGFALNGAVEGATAIHGLVRCDKPQFNMTSVVSYFLFTKKTFFQSIELWAYDTSFGKGHSKLIFTTHPKRSDGLYDFEEAPLTVPDFEDRVKERKFFVRIHHNCTSDRSTSCRQVHPNKSLSGAELPPVELSGWDSGNCGGHQ